MSSVAWETPVRTGVSPSPPASDRPSAHPHTRPTVPRTPPANLLVGAGSVLLRNASCMHGRRPHLAAGPESGTPTSPPRRGPSPFHSPPPPLPPPPPPPHQTRPG